MWIILGIIIMLILTAILLPTILILTDNDETIQSTGIILFLSFNSFKYFDKQPIIQYSLFFQINSSVKESSFTY